MVPVKNCMRHTGLITLACIWLSQSHMHTVHPVGLQNLLGKDIFILNIVGSNWNLKNLNLKNFLTRLYLSLKSYFKQILFVYIRNICVRCILSCVCKLYIKNKNIEFTL